VWQSPETKWRSSSSRCLGVSVGQYYHEREKTESRTADYTQAELAEMYREAQEEHRMRKASPFALLGRGRRSYEEDLDARVRATPDEVQDELDFLLADRENATYTPWRSRDWTVAVFREQLCRSFAHVRPEPARRHRWRRWRDNTHGGAQPTEFLCVLRGFETRVTADPAGFRDYYRGSNPWKHQDAEEARTRTGSPPPRRARPGRGPVPAPVPAPAPAPWFRPPQPPPLGPPFGPGSHPPFGPGSYPPFAPGYHPPSYAPPIGPVAPPPPAPLPLHVPPVVPGPAYPPRSYCFGAGPHGIGAAPVPGPAFSPPTCFPNPQPPWNPFHRPLQAGLSPLCGGSVNFAPPPPPAPPIPPVLAPGMPRVPQTVQTFGPTPDFVLSCVSPTGPRDNAPLPGGPAPPVLGGMGPATQAVPLPSPSPVSDTSITELPSTMDEATEKTGKGNGPEAKSREEDMK